LVINDRIRQLAILLLCVARCEVIEGKRAQIIIKEVPYQQTRNRLAEQIGELAALL
jgi:DNA gyrase/topoisomerase IV subunit A